MTHLIALALCALQTPQADAEWRYVVPPDGDAMRRPTLVALPIGKGLPEGVQSAPEVASLAARYGVLRFGDEDSPRVTVALGLLPGGGEALFVDVDRDLMVAADERIEPVAPRRWEFSLPCATRDADDQPLLVPRRVAIELGPTGTVLGVATLGWLEGRATVGEREIAVRRRDGDANGFFHDADDHLWIDRNADGVWAPLDELFVVQPILSLDGERYALRSARLGDGLSFDRIEGTGRVRLSMRDAKGSERGDVVDASVLFVGRDGSAFLARAPGAATEVPVGEFRPTMVTLRLADPGGGEPWSYVFSERYEATDERWREVVKDGELVFDPIGALDFSIERIGELDEIAPEERLRVQLRLHTADRLLVTTCYRGKRAPSFGYGTLQATIALMSAEGVPIGVARSGFA